jgi:hypothetical protein
MFVPERKMKDRGCKRNMLSTVHKEKHDGGGVQSYSMPLKDAEKKQNKSGSNDLLYLSLIPISNGKSKERGDNNET